MNEIQTVTYKQISAYLGVSRITASKMAIRTRLYYHKKEKEAITLGQVLKANNLEK